jgi:hypothetical protein
VLARLLIANVHFVERHLPEFSGFSIELLVNIIFCLVKCHSKITTMHKGNNGTYFEDSLTIKGNNCHSYGNDCIMKGNNNVNHGKRGSMKGNNCTATDHATKMKGDRNKYADGYIAPVEKKKKKYETSFQNINLDSVNAIGSVFGSGNVLNGFTQKRFGGVFTQVMHDCHIGSQEFVWGSQTLILRNLTPSKMKNQDGLMTFTWDDHKLTYRPQMIFYDGQPVDMRRIFEALGNSRVTQMEWSDFILQIPIQQAPDQPQPQVPEIKLPEGKDEPTDDEAKACVICLENLKCCLLLPCRHVCVCIACSNNLKDRPCPLCRTLIITITHVFT